jgi:hypothetical protein
MDKDESTALLRAELDRYRSHTYRELVELVGDSESIELTGASGAKYQVEIEVFWDGHPGGDLRVMASIDDGGWSAFKPLTESFVMNPPGVEDNQHRGSADRRTQ